MSWLAVKLWLAKAWSFTKQHWQLPFLAMWSVAVWMLTRRNSQAVIDVLNAKKESYDKQISILKQKHNEEILKRDQLIEKYHETIDIIKKEYKKKNIELDKKEKEKVKEIVAKAKGDPVVIRKGIEKAFGFTYVD